MRLKLAAMGSKSGVARTALNALQPRFEIEQIGPAGGHAGADFVVGEAANIAEIIFDAVAQEFAFEAAARCLIRPSTMMRTMPWAARRSPNGSREPVGVMPTLRHSTSVSHLSARLRIRPACGGGDLVFHAERLVVIVDGLRDFFGFTLRARVEAADDALQIGELFHHVGGQIAFAQQRRAFVPAELFHQRDDALRLVVIRTELGLECDGLQVFEPRGFSVFF